MAGFSGVGTNFLILMDGLAFWFGTGRKIERIGLVGFWALSVCAEATEIVPSNEQAATMSF